LLDELYASLADRSTARLLKHLSRLQPLVIDKVDNLSVKPEQANAFFRLIDRRYNRVSTIITTALDLSEWCELFERKHLVDALLDRLQHRCITIRIDGASLRTPEPVSSATAVAKRRVSSAEPSQPAR
jgi:DNA replication protein DnaC